MVFDAEELHVQPEPDGDGGGHVGDHCRSLSPGHGAPAQCPELAPGVYSVLPPPDSRDGHHHHLLPGLLWQPCLQQVPPNHICHQDGNHHCRSTCFWTSPVFKG